MSQQGPAKQPPEEEKEFKIISNAKELAKHTRRMTSARRFPKRFADLVRRMNDTALEILERVQEANELDLADPAEARERRYHQRKSMTKCKTMLFFIEQARESDLISKEQCEEWARKVLDVKRPVATWTKQDRGRAADYQRRNAPRR